MVGSIASTGIPIATATAIARATFSASIQTAVRRLGLNQQIDPSSPLWLSEADFDSVFEVT
ncbi:MAG TPA: hypothetical protein DCQ98_17795 [Planctomycetaceae bacterium]|nr:hypothetical protein [Planctomycetaceae bacterium]